MYPLKTVSMHAPSSSSCATCVLLADGCPRTSRTKSALMTSCSTSSFFSTFEEMNLPIHGPMEDAEVLKLYHPGPIQCLYEAPVDHMVGRVPLILLFLAGNSTPTIPHKFSKHKGSGFPMGCADTAASDGRRGCNVSEVNTWLWNFGCGKPRLGVLTVEEISMR